MLNDAAGDLPAGEVEVVLVSGGSAERLLLWAHPGAPAGRNLAGPSVRVVLPASKTGEFELVLRAGPGDAWGSRYRLSLRP
jgi:hypothetical protein